MDPTSPPTSRKLYRFALSKVLTLTLLSLLIAGTLISVTNDLYAFVKPNRPITVTLETPLPLSELSQMLGEAGVVANPTVFQWYADYKEKKEALEQFHGTLELNSAMSYREILAAFFSKK
ncbi:MAG: hypothetical protein IJY47_00985 [Clostridia bacterium]|nr:hypothetical protein [Clostridia bacterium]